MRRDIAVRSLSWAGLVLLVALAAVALPSVVGGGQSASAQAVTQPAGDAAQPAASQQKPVPTADKTKEKKSSPKEAKGKKAKPKGRLPAYFSGVVTDEQRQKVYAIQKDFAAKIDPLRRQVESLTKERDEKIWALLTPEQKQKIDALKKDAKDARDAKKDGEAKPAKPAAKPDKNAQNKQN
jgi:hypothetical protein